jgi:hypothetical protein
MSEKNDPADSLVDGQTTETDQAKIPTDPLPPAPEAAPVAVTGQVALAIEETCHIAVFEGDPANAVNIVRIIPENQDSAEPADKHEDEEGDEPPPSSLENPEFNDEGIFCNLRPEYIATFPPSPATEPPPSGGRPTNRPPDDGVFFDVAMYRLAPPNVHPKKDKE